MHCFAILTIVSEILKRFYFFDKKEFVKYEIKKTNKFIDEKDEYNDLKYVGNFSWD